jgi:quercetin dioxygenase-like cupin family protein
MFDPTQQLSPRLYLAPSSTGREVLSGLLALARSGVSLLTPESPALVGRVRGLGPGVSFSGQVQILERDHPVDLVFPFEDSAHVGGAAWRASELLGPDHRDGIAKLRWLPDARDLPMHAHPTNRFIVVLDGRGFYHCSEQSVETFDGSSVRTIAARAGDVFIFGRGVVHTFSTIEHAMTLLSCHLPFLPLDDPAQYTLPHFRWTATEHFNAIPSMVVEGWSRAI